MARPKKKKPIRRKRFEPVPLKPIEELFVKYANAPLRKKPETLLDIFKVIDEHSEAPGSSQEPSFGMRIANLVVEFSKLNDPDAATRLFDQQEKAKGKKSKSELARDFYGEKRSGGQLLEEHRKMAFYAVYGHGLTGGICRGNDCPFGLYYDEMTQIAHPKKEGQVRCLECQQLVFRNLLDILILRKDITEIKTPPAKMDWSKISKPDNIILFNSPSVNLYSTYLKQAFDCVYRYVDIDADELISTDKISYAQLTDLPSEDKDSKETPSTLFGPIWAEEQTRFVLFLNSIIGYSLFQYLSLDDLARLHRCETCQEFFVAKKVKSNRRYCSDRCRFKAHYTARKAQKSKKSSKK